VIAHRNARSTAENGPRLADRTFADTPERFRKLPNEVVYDDLAVIDCAMVRMLATCAKACEYLNCYSGGGESHGAPLRSNVELTGLRGFLRRSG
jgi:hypothetical protein